MQGSAFVDGKLVCESIIKCQLVQRERDGSSQNAPVAPE
jgi:hypothetical protein